MKNIEKYTQKKDSIWSKIPAEGKATIIAIPGATITTAGIYLTDLNKILDSYLDKINSLVNYVFY